MADAHNVMWGRRGSRAERTTIRAKVAEMHDDGADSRAIAKALHIPRELATRYELQRGRPFGAEPQVKFWKLDQYESRITEKIAEGKSDKAIARELGLSPSSARENHPVRSTESAQASTLYRELP